MTSVIQPYLVDAVIYFNEMKAITTIHFNKARSENAIVGALSGVFDIIVKLLKAAFLWATRLRLEPPDDTPFISLYEYNQTLQKTGEHVELIDSKTTREDLSSKFQEFVEKAKTSCLVNTTLLLARVVPDVMRIRLAANANGERDIIAPFVQSHAQFLSVEYYCSKDKAILIDIPKSHFIVGNELLSTEYVLRYLEHLPVYIQWDFDEFYRIRIVDENLQKTELRSNQWILLNENGYEVCSMAVEENESEEEEEEEEEEKEEEEEEESSSSSSEPGSPLESESDSDEN